MRLVIVVIAYEAAGFIAPLLDRIPSTVCGSTPTILVADDHSSDRTFELATDWADRHPARDVRTLRHPRNLGYGGNQKACYAWADVEGYDTVVLLHGDAQYPPEQISALLAPIVEHGAAGVFGSRFLEVGTARRGGMPYIRLVGNRALTALSNRLSGAHLTEWFSGFRAYRVELLRVLDLERLPNGFDFDVAITHAILLAEAPLREVAIPTRYGDEVSRVPLVRFGLQVVRSAMANRVLHQARRRRGALVDPGLGDPDAPDLVAPERTAR